MGPDVIGQLEAMRTPEDDAAVVESHLAELRGDAAGALDAMARTFNIVGSPRIAYLEHLDRLGDDAPEWLIGRWLRKQAYGWMLHQQDPRVTVAAKYATLTHGVPDLCPSEMRAWWDEYAPRVVASDALCHHFAVHDLGGFADFLESAASPGLIARAGRVREWPGAPLRVYELREVDGDVLVVRDHATGRDHRTLHVGAGVGNGPGDLLLGCLVPVDTAPGEMFVTRPILIDPVTADNLVEVLDEDDPLPLCFVLARAADGGRMLSRPGTRDRTQLWSDIIDEPDEVHPTGDDDVPGRVRELMDAGLHVSVAEALCTCELALELPTVVPGAVEIVAQHAAYNLAQPVVYDAARRFLTRPGDAEGWEAIARCVPEPSRTQCLELAALSRATDDAP